jgi:hypothetical protein
MLSVRISAGTSAILRFIVVSLSPSKQITVQYLNEATTALFRVIIHQSFIQSYKATEQATPKLQPNNQLSNNISIEIKN